MEYIEADKFHIFGGAVICGAAAEASWSYKLEICDSPWRLTKSFIFNWFPEPSFPVFK
jgi:hypothetical protein